jgi:hypothetical protein
MELHHARTGAAVAAAALWKLPELWTQRTRPRAPWKTLRVFHSFHRASSSWYDPAENTESVNLSTKPGAGSRRRKCRQKPADYVTLRVINARSGEGTTQGGKVLKRQGPFLLKTDKGSSV